MCIRDRNKIQVKITSEYTGNYLIRADFHTAQKYLSEELALPSKILKDKLVASNHTDLIDWSKEPSVEFHVFDNGLKGRNNFDILNNNRIAFITKLKKNTRFDLSYPHWQDDGFQDSQRLEFIQDSIVRLYKSGGKLHPQPYRLVQYRNKEEDKIINFLTNVIGIDLSLIHI